MISRRQFFRELLHPRTLRKLNPIPAKALVELGQSMGVVPEPADACEQAGMALRRIRRKHSVASLVAAADSDTTTAPAADEAGPNPTGA